MYYGRQKTYICSCLIFLLLANLNRKVKCTTGIVIMLFPLSVGIRPLSLIFHIFDFSSETADQNSTKPDRNKDLNVLYHVCVFRTD